MKVNNKKCISCGREDQPWFSKKRCKNCATIEDRKPLKRGSTIKKQTEKNKSYRKSQSEIRNEYFDYHISICKVSEESGVAIPNPTRANICHIFDKARHPSVQANLYNYVYLTLDEHTRFDQLLYQHAFEILEREFPNCLSKVLYRADVVSRACTERTKFFIKLEEWIQSKKSEID
jgi:hypothetical protein